MKYGMPTLVELENILDNVNLAKAYNLDFIELNMDLPYCQNIKKQELKKYNLEFTMHLSEKLNIAELNNNLRKSYLNETIRQIELGINNNIKKYNLHIDSGVYFTLPSGKYYLNDKYLDIYLMNLEKSCQKLNEIAKKYNIEINFENTKIHNFTQKAINLINGFSNLGFTLDIGHNEKNKNLAYQILKKTNKIRHIHIHDYDGKSDHLEIGKGIIDFKKYQKVVNKCYAVIEVKEKQELINSLKKLKTLNL